MDTLTIWQPQDGTAIPHRVCTVQAQDPRAAIQSAVDRGHVTHGVYYVTGGPRHWNECGPCTFTLREPQRPAVEILAGIVA